jgi:uncharacterized protein (DUF952 family)
MSLIYHLAKTGAWEVAVQSGEAYTGTADDAADGFLHFSTAQQIVESAARHRAGERDLVLLAVDANALSNELRWERSRGGAEFPHLYGALPMAAVRWTKPLPLGPDGHHVFPELD